MSNQSTRDREALKKKLLSNGYSEQSASYLTNTYFLRGIENSWEKKTKRLIKSLKLHI